MRLFGGRSECAQPHARHESDASEDETERERAGGRAVAIEFLNAAVIGQLLFQPKVNA